MSISPPAPAPWKVDLDDFTETQLADFGAVEMREKGMVGAAMGTTALSANGDFWAIPVKTGKVSRFIVVETRTGKSSVILERDTIGHPQFCPDDDNLILYAGPLTDRVWTVARDGAYNRRAYAREDRMQWVTHEVWLPGRRAIAFVDWPRGMRPIDIDTGKAEWLHRFPSWHAAPDASRDALGLRHQFSRSGPAHHSARRLTGVSLRQRGDIGRRALGPSVSRTMTVRSRSRRASTPIRIRASRRTASAWSLPRTAPALPRSTKSSWTEARHEG